MHLPFAATHKRRRRLGFTLAEVLVAVAIAGFAFVSLYASIAQSFATWQRSRERMRGNQILLEKLEVIRLYSWSQLNTSGFVPSTFTEYFHPASSGTNASAASGVAYTGTMTVTNANVAPAYTNTMRRVAATLNWVRGGVTNRLQMETLVSQYGVQNYIY